MARPGISYDQVAAVAEQLVLQGVREPGAAAVRDELVKRAKPGGEVGSPNTIQRHLVAWRKNRPEPLAESKTLPSQLAGDLSRALMAAADVAREAAESRLAQLQSEQDSLVALGEANEAKIDNLTEQLVERTTQRDELSGKLLAQTQQAGRIQDELAASRAAEQAALQQLSASRASEQSANVRAEEIRGTAERERAELQAQLTAAREGLSEAIERAGQGEQRAAVAEARFEAASTTCKALQAQLDLLTANVSGLVDAAARTAAAEGAITALQEQNSLLQQTNALLQSMVKAAGGLSP